VKNRSRRKINGIYQSLRKSKIREQRFESSFARKRETQISIKGLNKGTQNGEKIRPTLGRRAIGGEGSRVSRIDLQEARKSGKEVTPPLARPKEYDSKYRVK